ncbi:hypothetical protein [Chryseobacterium caseinilyticum]|uniref:Uncharacterized protein n=1 Tax=Chryseobacterium caseinilyticum TaxID=2771428 RepID=A0ABR8ZH80_9FLAO|nr:hypothetical protein [Chryseobacterium caseinilyticum]MBD8084647.1 hypothetical protein [Chryseobacterium caseinilyticum]
MTLNLLLCARNSTEPLIHQLVETGKELNVGESFEYGTYYQSLLDSNTEKSFEDGYLEPGIYKVLQIEKDKDISNVKLQLT